LLPIIVENEGTAVIHYTSDLDIGQLGDTNPVPTAVPSLTMAGSVVRRAKIGEVAYPNIRYPADVPLLTGLYTDYCDRV
jgi:hypothetical protein